MSKDDEDGLALIDGLYRAAVARHGDDVRAVAADVRAAIGRLDQPARDAAIGALGAALPLRPRHH